MWSLASIWVLAAASTSASLLYDARLLGPLAACASCWQRESPINATIARSRIGSKTTIDDPCRKAPELSAGGGQEEGSSCSKFASEEAEFELVVVEQMNLVGKVLAIVAETIVFRKLTPRFERRDLKEDESIDREGKEG